MNSIDLNRPFPKYLVPLFQNKPVLMQNLSYENEPVGETHFHMNYFARRLILPQVQVKGDSEVTY